MAGELAYWKDGLPVTFKFMLKDLAANGTTAMTGALATPGYKVPAGYKFVPMLIGLSSSAELDGGTCIAKVTADATAVVNGPEATIALALPKQHATAVVREGQPASIAAGSVVCVELVASAAYSPETADLDAVVSGVMVPA